LTSRHRITSPKRPDFPLRTRQSWRRTHHLHCIEQDLHQPRCCPPAWETTGATPGWPPPSVAFYSQIYATYVRGSVTGHRPPSCVRQVRTPGSCSRMSHAAGLGSRRPRESARPAPAATTATTRPRAYWRDASSGPCGRPAVLTTGLAKARMRSGANRPHADASKKIDIPGAKLLRTIRYVPLALRVLAALPCCYAIPLLRHRVRLPLDWTRAAGISGGGSIGDHRFFRSDRSWCCRPSTAAVRKRTH
jgi:hypothetical protein